VPWNALYAPRFGLISGNRACNEACSPSVAGCYDGGGLRGYSLQYAGIARDFLKNFRKQFLKFYGHRFFKNISNNFCHILSEKNPAKKIMKVFWATICPKKPLANSAGIFFKKIPGYGADPFSPRPFSLSKKSIITLLKFSTGL
jgi:hypothetical protein